MINKGAIKKKRAETRDYSELMWASSPDLNQERGTFSLTLSQLSYLGSDASIENNVK